MDFLWILVGVPIAYIYNMILALRKENRATNTLLFEEQRIFQKELADHKLHVAENYVKQESMLRLEERIFKKLDTIEKMLHKNK